MAISRWASVGGLKEESRMYSVFGGGEERRGEPEEEIEYKMRKVEGES